MRKSFRSPGAAPAALTRRAALRPRLTRDGSDAEDPLPFLERTMTSGLAESDDDARVAVALGLLALNDAHGAAAALGVVRSDIDDPRAALATGAWAAWRGEMLPVVELREAGMRWLRTMAGAAVAVDDELAACALLLAPAAAEAADDIALLERLRRRPGQGGSLERLASAARVAGEAAAAAGEALTALHGLLGIVPDAPRGRVRLAPDLTEGAYGIDGLAVGDTMLSLRTVNRELGTIAIVVEQTAGAMPLTAILEPRLPARRLRQVEVDGRPATLDARQDGNGLCVSVQLVIDQPRRLTIGFE